MKHILKKRYKEPKALTEYRSTPNATYAGLHGGVKQALREALGSEQGFICAYCMSRIKPDVQGTVIEHYITQVRHTESRFDEQTHQENQLNYNNLLGTCNDFRSCSSIRGNVPLTVNPSDISCEHLVRFRNDGVAYSTDARVQSDIGTLKLNDQTLKDNRKVVIDVAREKLASQSPSKGWSNQLLVRHTDEWLSLKTTPYGLAYREYCMAAVHYLKSKTRK